MTFSPTHVRLHLIHLIPCSSRRLSQLVLATNLNLLVYALPKPPSEDNGEKTPKKKKGKQRSKGKEKEVHSRTPSQTPELRLVDTVDIPSVPGAPAQSVVTFRAAR